MSYFPFFMDLAGVPGLVIGGGQVARRKVEKLMPFGPKLTVVAPEFCPELAERTDVTLLRRPVRAEDLEGAHFVIAAAVPEVNARAAELCRKKRIPVNVVDDPAQCSFLFPSLVQRGKLTVGISTAGASPTAAIYLKERVNDLLPDNFDRLLDWLESLRPELKAAIPEEKQRSRVFSRLFHGAMALGRPLTEEELLGIIRKECGE